MEEDDKFFPSITGAEPINTTFTPPPLMTSISSMLHKSHEELRWEDYQLRNKGGAGIDTSNTLRPPLTSVNHSSSLFPSNPFIQQFGSIDQNRGELLDFSSLRSNPFIQQFDLHGSNLMPYTATPLDEKPLSISAYIDKSHEELRLEHYQLQGIGAAGIGTSKTVSPSLTSANSSSSLFPSIPFSSQGSSYTPRCFKCKGFRHASFCCPSPPIKVTSTKPVTLVERETPAPQEILKDETTEYVCYPNNPSNLEVVPPMFASSKSKNDPHLQRGNVFRTRVTCKGHLCSLLINTGSSFNLISEEAVNKLGLEVQQLPKPYDFARIDNSKLRVNKQCLVTFSVGKLTETVMCGVLPLKHFHIILGRTWIWDRDVQHSGRANTYSFVAGKTKYTLTCLTIPKEEGKDVSIQLPKINPMKNLTPYTAAPLDEKPLSISAYRDKSHEELRLEHYQLQGIGAAGIGTSKTFVERHGGESANVFSSSFPSNPFVRQREIADQYKGKSVNVSSYSVTTSPWSQCSYTPSPFGSQQLEPDNAIPEKVLSISAMPAYKDKSHEELRLEYYHLQSKDVKMKWL